MAKEIKKLERDETPEETLIRKNKAIRNRFIVLCAINLLLVAVIAFQIIWMVLH